MRVFEQQIANKIGLSTFGPKKKKTNPNESKHAQPHSVSMCSTMVRPLRAKYVILFSDQIFSRNAFFVCCWVLVAFPALVFYARFFLRCCSLLCFLHVYFFYCIWENINRFV